MAAYEDFAFFQTTRAHTAPPPAASHPGTIERDALHSELERLHHEVRRLRARTRRRTWTTQLQRLIARLIATNVRHKLRETA